MAEVEAMLCVTENLCLFINVNYRVDLFHTAIPSLLIPNSKMGDQGHTLTQIKVVLLRHPAYPKLYAINMHAMSATYFWHCVLGGPCGASLFAYVKPGNK